jgi:hypothetical protein
VVSAHTTRGSGTARGVRGLLLDADGRVRGLAAVILIM